VESVFSIETLIAFATLFALEVVLGVDNVIFISILAGKLPAELRKKAQTLGLGLAVITRVLLLLSLSWVIGLTAPLFTLWSQEISGRDLILILGGLFLIAKSTHEIHQKMEHHEGPIRANQIVAKFWPVIAQMLILDIVFSLDSVITAVGMVTHIGVMIAAVICATLFMIFTASAISKFVDKHPTIKILALSFLILIGVTLLADGLGQHIAKGYIYFAMSFSLVVEMINMRVRKT
jgi:predicted tellurium resistance membrane protein TerC